MSTLFVFSGTLRKNVEKFITSKRNICTNLQTCFVISAQIALDLSCFERLPCQSKLHMRIFASSTWPLGFKVAENRSGLNTSILSQSLFFKAFSLKFEIFFFFITDCSEVIGQSS